MEKYLTRKARPFWLRVALEVVLYVALGVWSLASVCVAVEKFRDDFSLVNMTAFALVGGVPMLICGCILISWVRRSAARRVALTLAAETDVHVTWDRLEMYGGIRNAQDTVGTLWQKGYVTNVRLEQDGVMRLAAQDMPMQPQAPNGGKCRMCGAPLEKRSFGDWACRHCGTVAGRE